MSDFGVEAELSVVVPRRELRSARQEVEDALADIPVGMSAGGGGMGGGGTNAAREQRRRRREFRWARQRTDDTEAQLEVLENIEGELTEGGLGGGGGIFGDLLGVTGEGAGIATDLGTSVVDAVAPALGSLVGTFVGQSASDATGGGGGGGGTVTIPKPEWVPVEVRDPSPLGVEGVPTVTVQDPPPLTVEDPSPLAVNDPSPLVVDDPSPLKVVDPSPLSVNAPMLQVEKPGWVPIEVERPGGRGSTDGRRRRRSVRRPDAFNRGIRSIPFIGDILGDADRRLRPSAGGELAFPLPGESPTPGNDPAGRPQTASASTGDVNVTVNADVQGAVQQAVEQVRREQERQRQELRRDLEGQISDLRRQIQSGGRSGLGGSVT